MRLSHHIQILIALVVGAALLAGCGGDDDTATDEAGATDEATPAEAEDDDNADDEAADTDDDTDESMQSGDFADLANRGFASEARVTYELQQDGEDPQTMVLSSDGEQTAWLMPDGRMITRADGTSIFCDESGQQAQCFEAGGEGQAGPMAGASPFFGMATAFQDGVENFPGFAHTGSEEIAGRSATCGTFEPTQFATGQDVGEATLCLDDDTGVMLRYEARDPEGAASSIEAVEVGEPEASDFEPPAEPVRFDQGG